MKTSLLLIVIFLGGCSKFLPLANQKTKNPTQQVEKQSANETFSIFHYNIKELTTGKLLNPKDKQLLAVKEVIDHHQFDILSINEIQYDLPGVPSFEFNSQGENLVRLINFLGLDASKWNHVFAPANTGSHARRNLDGAYFVEESKEAREHADPLNYGLFPAQYSTAGILRERIIDKAIINDLKWVDFNPNTSPTNFSLPDGRPLPPDLVLFDKNFNHVVTSIDGKPLHIIFLHTVPSYHFGNKNSPNYQRNADQLRFMEWYITGKTEFEVQLDRSKWPEINKDDGVIVVGDLNADVNQKDNPGGAVLRRLMKTLRPWMADPGPTNESSGFNPKPFSLHLDYILVSANLDIVKAGVIRPKAEPIYLGCKASIPKKLAPKLRAGRVIIDYVDYKTNKTCYGTVSQAYYTAKMASDHFPIYAQLRFK